MLVSAAIHRDSGWRVLHGRCSAPDHPVHEAAARVAAFISRFIDLERPRLYIIDVFSVFLGCAGMERENIEECEGEERTLRAPCGRPH